MHVMVSQDGCPYWAGRTQNDDLVGAKVVVLMMAGDKEQGGLKSKDVIIKYEHLARHAQRVLSNQFVSDSEERLQIQLPMVAQAIKVARNSSGHIYGRRSR